jgi:putative transposase
VFIVGFERLSDRSNWIDLEFIERERTPEKIIELDVQLHLVGLSLSNTKQYLEIFGVKWSQTAIHNWVQKADLQPTSEAEPNHIAVAETVIQLNDDGVWTLLSIQIRTNSSIYGSFRLEQRNSLCTLSASSRRKCRLPK